MPETPLQYLTDELNKLREQKLYQELRILEGEQLPEARFDGRQVINLSSNNYLGLTTHPKVKEAAIEAIRKYGTSCTGSRFLNGTLHLHVELESRLAEFVDMQKALVFSTGFQTNLGTISALVGAEDVVVTDREVHASIIDGVRMSRGQRAFFKHNDMDDLERILKKYPREKGKLIIVDGVFSMSGDIAPLPELVALGKTYNAQLMIDDAHSIGVLGGGRGTAFHFNCSKEVDLVMGTFSKSFASIGGFIAGSEEVIDWIRHFARPLIFSASLPAPNVAAVLAVLEIIENEPEHVERVNKIGEKMRKELKAMGYNIGNTQTPIIPIIIGDMMKTMQAWKTLYEEGIYTNVAVPPAVPANTCLLRTSYMATHTDEQLDKVLDTFKKLNQLLC
jgi:8-amino-7-oxononanoate synthase